MTDNTRRIKAAKFHLPHRGKKMFREFEVYYDEGGTNFMTYREKKRGFYLSSKIVEIDGMWVKWSQGQTGDGYLLIEEASRFNRKRLMALVANVEKAAEEMNRVWEDPETVYDAVGYIHALALDDALVAAKAKEAP